jgi:hypothetical protein
LGQAIRAALRRIPPRISTIRERNAKAIFAIRRPCASIQAREIDVQRLI